MALPLPSRISGATLRTLARASKAAPARFVFSRLARGDLGLDELLALDPNVRAPFPLHQLPVQARASHARGSQNLGTPSAEPALATAAVLSTRFANQEQTPTQVLEHVLGGIKSLDRRTPGMNPMLVVDEDAAYRAAEAATRRWSQGRAIGALDGVPITIKEQTNMLGLPSRAGTDYLPNMPASADAFVVKKLRDAGAVLVGHTVMTEFGMTPVGYNGKRNMPKNPHHPGCSAAGSSTGGGVSVATGLVPLALGADGGGSIRTPAACNGIFGIKPTFGRISRTGDIFGGSMCHLGPLGRNARELALFVDVTGEVDADDHLMRGAPKSDASAGLGRGVAGLRIGIPEDEWKDAEVVVQRAGKAALAALEKEGAILVPIGARLLRHAPAIGYLTIATEAYTELLDVRTFHHDQMAPDLQFFLSLVQELEPDSYLDAQRLRVALRHEVASILREVDVIAMPTLVGTAPRLTDDELREGFVDPKLLSSLCRFAFLGNLTGLPAASCPVGKDADGLPIGLQIIGDAFDEACVIQVVDHLERIGASVAERPSVYVDL